MLSAEINVSAKIKKEIDISVAVKIFFGEIFRRGNS